MSTITLGVELTVVNCGECGGSYAINERYHQQAREKGTSWTCPYCKCGWGFSGNGEIQRLRKQVETEQAARVRAQERAQRYEERAEHERRRAMGFKGALTKVKNRVSKGVCPCCQRTFANLHQHMTKQHPTWAPDGEPSTPNAK